MLDRYRTSALPFSGSSLLTDHYAEVPLLSVAWGIGKISVPLKSDGISLMGFHFPVALNTTFIGSLRWGGALHLRIEEIAPTDLAATRLIRRVEHHSRHRPSGRKQSALSDDQCRYTRPAQFH